MELRSGTQIGQFVLEKQLGIGSLGEVWVAKQPSLYRNIALKILSPELLSENTIIERFLAEARILGKLQHPNIVPIFEIGNEEGFYYLASKYINGITLEEKLEAHSKLTERYALEIVLVLGETLKYAWDNFNLSHRDLKPANIMFDEDQSIFLMDLGISKDFEDNPNLAQASIVIGSPYYMSPEQARSEDDIDFKADIYSLGCTLFHCVTGQFPFNANSPMGILAKHITEPLPDPRSINPAISPVCSELIRWMMEKSPGKRPKNWDSVITAVKRVQNGLHPKQKKNPKQQQPPLRPHFPTKKNIPKPQMKKTSYAPIEIISKATKDKSIRQVPIPTHKKQTSRFVGQIVEKKKKHTQPIPIKGKSY